MKQLKIALQPVKPLLRALCMAGAGADTVTAAMVRPMVSMEVASNCRPNEAGWRRMRRKPRIGTAELLCLYARKNDGGRPATTGRASASDISE